MDSRYYPEVNEEEEEPEDEGEGAGRAAWGWGGASLQVGWPGPLPRGPWSAGRIWEAVLQ